MSAVDQAREPGQRAAKVQPIPGALLGLSVGVLASVAYAQPPAEPKPEAPAQQPAAAPEAPPSEAPQAPPGAEQPPTEQPPAAEAAPPEAATAAPESAAAPEPAEPQPVEPEPATPEPEPAEEDVVVSGGGLFEEGLSEAPEPTEAGGEAAGGLRFELNGYVRADTWVGKVPDSSKWEMKAGYGELSLQLRTQREKYGDAYAETRLRYGLQNEEQDFAFDLREAYVNLYAGPLDLRIGQQIIVWGRADAFSPTNNLTPIDLRVRSPVEDDRRLGNVGLRTFLNLTPVRVEGVWMPLYSPIRVPEVALPELVRFGEPTYPEPSLDNGLFAGRVHLELPEFEASVSYLYGHALMPGLDLTSYQFGEDAEAVITRRAYDHHVVGFDFSTAISDIVAVRGEAAYRRPLHYEDRVYAPRPDVQYVLGLDREFGSVSVIVQYMGRYVFDWQYDEPGDRGPSYLRNVDIDNITPQVEEEVRTAADQELRHRNQILFQQTEEVQHMASLRLEWITMHDTLTLSALGVANFTTEEWLVYPKLGYKVSDWINTYVGGEVYVGPDGSLLDLVDERLSAGYVELRASF